METPSIQLAILCVGLQGTAMVVDEFYFHRQRGLGLWERVGHPIDSFFFVLALILPGFFPFNDRNLSFYIIAAAVSTLIITKDEWIHAKQSSGTEQWLHAVLFALHPTILFFFYLLWQSDTGRALRLGLPTMVLVFMFYQLIYWNLRGIQNAKPSNTSQR